MIECDLDSTFLDYRERLVVSDGTVRCCETRILIPEGFVYAECQGCFDGRWERFPQSLEVWRFLRNMKVKQGHCLPFEGVDDELEWIEQGGAQEDWLFLVKWKALRKRICERYEKGLKPRLHVWEKGALEKGLWYDWIQCPAGGFVFKLSEDGESRVPVPPNTPFGQIWDPTFEGDY